LSFTAAAPEDAWRITHALVDLLIDSTLARQRAALLREQAGAESAVDRAEQHSGDQTLADRRSSLGRLKTTDARAADVRLGLRAAEEQQALRFELVDPGRVPAKATRAVLFRDAAVTFVMALLAACLLAGAFDPRIIDAADISGAGVAVLGHLPLLPSAPGPRASRNTPETPPVSSDDRGPRV
jgi:hypothetical protein